MLVKYDNTRKVKRVITSKRNVRGDKQSTKACYKGVTEGASYKKKNGDQKTRMPSLSSLFMQQKRLKFFHEQLMPVNY